MIGKPSQEEKAIFRQAYEYFEKHCNPPPNQNEEAVQWWIDTAEEFNALNNHWKEYPLMSSFLFGIFDYIEAVARKKTKELEEFV